MACGGAGARPGGVAAEPWELAALPDMPTVPPTAGSLRAALRDFSRAWEAVGRCLASLTVGGSGTGTTPLPAFSSLRERLHSYCTCLTERLAPDLDECINMAPWALAGRRPASSPVAQVAARGVRRSGGDSRTRSSRPSEQRAAVA